MKRKTITTSLSIFFAAALLLAGVPTTTSVRAQASTQTFRFILPVDDESIDCDGFSQIETSGTLHVIVHLTTSASGHETAHIHENYRNVTGVDEAGNRYRVNQNFTDVDTFSEIDGQFSNTIERRLRLIGRGKTANKYVRTKLHITFNANGELTANFFDFEVDCK